MNALPLPGINFHGAVAIDLSHSEPFTRHGTRKDVQASVRRPGNHPGRQPSCTKAEASSHASPTKQQRRKAAYARFLAEAQAKGK